MQSLSATQVLLQRAHADHRAGRLREAERGYRKVLRVRPNDPDALHFLGMLQFQRGEPAAGIAFVRRALRALDTNPHAWNNLGNMLLATGDAAAAAEAFEQATSWGGQMAETWYNRAICMRRLRRYDEAIHHFTKAVELNPQATSVYERLGMMLYSLGRFREAGEIYRKWLQADPEQPVARHMLAAMTNSDVPARADDDYLRQLFDRFASGFDASLGELGYRAPELLASTLGEYVSTERQLEMLDIGCGTGLCGPLLHSMARRLVGVDISAGMIEKARERNVYDELIEAELSTFLRARPGEFDVIVAADTLVYFGALTEVSHAAHDCLRPGGLFAFTLEQWDEPTNDYSIQPHGRYAHAEHYVRRVLGDAGFEQVQVKPVVLRQERGVDVAGHLVTALVGRSNKPAASADNFALRA